MELLGRDALVGTVARAIETERSVAVTGEAGIGKTSLVRAAVEASGRRLREGAGFASRAQLPNAALGWAIGGRVSGDAARIAAAVEHAVGPDILFVDDLQWVDRSTAAALRLLAGRILIVGAVRTGDPGTTTALELAADLELDEVQVDALDPAASADLARRVRPDLDPADVDRIVRAASGNPLLVEELASTGRASEAVARLFTSRVDLLSPRGRDAVELLAVADRPIDRSRLDGAVREAIVAGVVADHDGALRIRHELVAEAIRSGLSTAALRRLHVQASRLVDEPAEAARHLALGGQRRAAAALAWRALDGATDPTEVAALRVLIAEASTGPDALAQRLVAARALDELSEWDAIARLLRPASRGGPDAVTERDLLLARAAYGTGRLDDARADLARAQRREIAPDGAVAARRVVELATFAVNVDGAVPEALAAIERGITAAVPSSEGHRDLVVLRESILALAAGAGDLGLLRSAADEALDRGRSRTSTDLARVVSYALLMQVGAEPALEWQLDRRQAFASANAASVALEFHGESVHALILAGRLADAVTQADEVLELPAPPRAHQAATIFRARALALLGRYEDAAAGLSGLGATLTADYFGAAEALAVDAEIALWSGRPALAAELATRALAFRTPLPGINLAVQVVGDWARWEAGLLLDPDVPTPPTRSLAGALPEAIGLRSLEAGRADDAAESFAAASEAWSRFHRPRELMCSWATGEALRRAGRGREAMDRLAAALPDADSVGIEPVATRIRRSLRQLGVRIAAARDPRHLPRPALTRREREIVDLVATGATNVEIARRLGLGRPTVARILASAMNKAGVEGRNQLVASGNVLRAVDASNGHRATGAPTPANPLDVDHRAILGMLARGHTLGEVSEVMGIPRRTLDRRLGEARRRVGAARTTEAVATASRLGWLVDGSDEEPAMPGR